MAIYHVLCVHVQVSNAHGWHGARNMARTNKQHMQQQQQKQKQQQQKQQQEQKQKQQQKQKQSNQQQHQHQQSGAVETRVSSLSPDSAGALSVHGVKARIPAFAHTASSDITVC